jgi:hypothetical protein
MTDKLEIYKSTERQPAGADEVTWESYDQEIKRGYELIK